MNSIYKAGLSFYNRSHSRASSRSSQRSKSSQNSKGSKASSSRGGWKIKVHDFKSSEKKGELKKEDSFTKI